MNACPVRLPPYTPTLDTSLRYPSTHQSGHVANILCTNSKYVLKHHLVMNAPVPPLT